MRPGSQPDMQQLMAQAQKMQRDMAAAQEALASAEIAGSSGGGLVTVTVNGMGELQTLVIDPKVIDPDDAETLADLVIAAVRDAARATEELRAEKMGPVAGGLESLGWPGF